MAALPMAAPALPRITKANAADFDPPPLTDFMAASSRGPGSRPANWYWQMTGDMNWDRQSASYQKQTKKWRGWVGGNAARVEQRGRRSAAELAQHAQQERTRVRTERWRVRLGHEAEEAAELRRRFELRLEAGEHLWHARRAATAEQRAFRLRSPLDLSVPLDADSFELILNASRSSERPNDSLTWINNDRELVAFAEWVATQRRWRGSGTDPGPVPASYTRLWADWRDSAEFKQWELDDELEYIFDPEIPDSDWVSADPRARLEQMLAQRRGFQEYVASQPPPQLSQPPPPQPQPPSQLSQPPPLPPSHPTPTARPEQLASSASFELPASSDADGSRPPDVVRAWALWSALAGKLDWPDRICAFSLADVYGEGYRILEGQHADAAVMRKAEAALQSGAFAYFNYSSYLNMFVKVRERAFKEGGGTYPYQVEWDAV